MYIIVLYIDTDYIPKYILKWCRKSKELKLVLSTSFNILGFSLYPDY